MDERKSLLFQATLAERAERAEDSFAAIRKLCALDGVDELDAIERDAVSAGFKKTVAPRRTAWRALAAIEAAERRRGREAEASIVREHMRRVKEEVRDICDALLEAVDAFEKTGSTESKAFFGKMKGDYNRYVAEVTTGEERAKAIGRATKAYERAMAAAMAAKTGLAATHPVLLGLGLNYSVFHHEILDERQKAIELARETFDNASDEMDELSEDSFADAVPVLQLLRDNITMWTNASENEEGNDESESPREDDREEETS